jgi:hypothetical protein
MNKKSRENTICNADFMNKSMEIEAMGKPRMANLNPMNILSLSRIIIHKIHGNAP